MIKPSRSAIRRWLNSSVQAPGLVIGGSLLILLGHIALTETDLWYHLIGPFDRRPDPPGLMQILADPASMSRYRTDLCAWSRREDVRRKTEVTRALVATACKPR